MATTLAVCGFGRAGKIHFSSIRRSPECRLKYVVDVSCQKEKIEDYLKQWNCGHIKFVSTEEFGNIVLKDEEVSGVIVTTPTSSHKEYVCKALEHGKGVFCEKPVAENLSSTTQCYELAAKTGLPLFCAFNRRFDDAFYNVKKKVELKAIGKVYSIKTTSRDGPALHSPEYLRTSHGIFHDSSVHDIDMICWLVGEEPIEIYAQGFAHHSTVQEMADLDTVAIVMKFPSGVIGSIDQNRFSSYGYDQRLEVFGEKGFLTVDNVNKVPITMATENGITETPYLPSFPQRYEQAYYNEMMHFVSVLKDPSVILRVTREDAERSIRLADACVASYNSKKTVILNKLELLL